MVMPRAEEYDINQVVTFIDNTLEKTQKKEFCEHFKAYLTQPDDDVAVYNFKRQINNLVKEYPDRVNLLNWMSTTPGSLSPNEKKLLSRVCYSASKVIFHLIEF